MRKLAVLVAIAGCGSDPVHHLPDGPAAIDAAPDAEALDAGCMPTFDDGSGPVAVAITGAPGAAVAFTTPAAGTLALCAARAFVHITATADLTIAGVSSATTIVDGDATGTPLTVATAGITVTAHDVAFAHGIGTTTLSTLTAGGAIYCNGATLQLTNAIVSGSSAALGGGVFATGCTVDATDTSITGNTSNSDGGGYATLTKGTTTFTRVTASGNTTSGDGGGIAVLGAARLDLIDPVVTDNTAANQDGGGLWVEGTVTCSHATATAAITANSGFGVVVAGNAASYTSTNCDYGTDAMTNNTPDDIDAHGTTSTTFDFGDAASFTCSDTICS